MKANVDRDGCIGCGLCVQTCPEVFEMEDGLAAVRVEIAPEWEEEVIRARDLCPVSVIDVEE